ncbi:MAG: DsbA family protein [Pseudomonadaceae bacterium]|nr:MAG: DsbA family protein [Pseudomonadaceae bacterium]
MSQRLIYVMDPMCSWCWGFAPVIEQIIQAGEVPVHLVAGGLRAAREPLEASTRDALREHWTAVTQASGQPFTDVDKLPADFCYTTTPACRALVTARGLNGKKVWPLVQAMQSAFYTRAEDITDTSTLVSLAESVGYKAQRFAAAYDAEDSLAGLASDISWVRDLGISGFPTLLAERDGLLALLANGYQPPEAVQGLLGRWLAAGAQQAV